MKRKPIKLPLYISSREMADLVKKIRKDRHRLGIAIMAYGGLRVSEMCSLRVKDLHLARGFMRVTGKGGRERVVPLSSYLQKEIDSYLTRYGQALDQESYLVGRSRSSWHYLVKKYARRNLGRHDIHCHTLRHSFATALYHDGVQLERISELLGHSSLDTTMIYSHISIEQKRDAVMVLDGRRSRILKFLQPMVKKHPDMKVKNSGSLIGRDAELEQLRGFLSRGVSVVLYGVKGCGKSMLLRQIENSVFINEYRKKASLIRMILEPRHLTREIYKETEKSLKKLSIDELIEEVEKVRLTIVIDDITDLSRPDRNVIAKLAEKTVLATATSRKADVKLFPTVIQVNPLKRHYQRQILFEMIQMNDQVMKETVVNDILHSSGENLKKASYIASQMQLGRSSQDIVMDDDEDVVYVAPFLLIVVLFFCAWVLKSYTTSVVAMSYAMLVVFRLVFMRFMFMPANRKKSK